MNFEGVVLRDVDGFGVFVDKFRVEIEKELSVLKGGFRR